jgi:hypothetical protein
MTRPAANSTRRDRTVRCAIYTRKSSEEGLEQEFNSLQAQREASVGGPYPDPRSQQPEPSANPRRELMAIVI